MKKRGTIILMFLITIILVLSGCGDTKKEQSKELTVFVAASLTDVITEISNNYKEATGTEVKLNLASSGTLARQIQEGGQCDIFISASKKWMDYANDEHLIDASSRCIPAKNALVLIAPKDKKDALVSNLAALPELFEGRLSLGDPSHVPAGKYAEEALKSLKIYEAFGDRFLPAKDVRSALMVVELGECDYGIVYKTDALKSEKVKIAATFPDSTQTPIVYHAAITSASLSKNEAKDFLTFITNKKSEVIWSKYGFKTK